MKLAEDFLVLLVEDNTDSREAALADLARALPHAVVLWAGDLESALGLIATHEFDLAVCDLKLPARSGELTTSENNGVRIVSELQASHPGTAIIILSAFGTVENTEPYTSGADRLSAFGLSALRMCQAAVKAAPDDFFNRLQTISLGVDAVGEVEVAGFDEIDPMLERAIAHAAAEQKFSHAEIIRAGGLSGSANAIVMLTATDRPTKRLFVKVDRRDWLLDELRRREQYVEGVLDASHWAQTVSVLKAGLRDKAAYFSSLATDPKSLFQVAEVDAVAAIRVLDRIESALEPWHLGQSESTQTVGDLRRAHMSDDQLSDHDLDLHEFADVEALSVTVSNDVIHGDLHAENVLVVDNGRPILIDFAYTEPGPAALDPITLEMAFLFHPMSHLKGLGARDVRFDRWAHGNYLPDMIDTSVVDRCREWALRKATTSEFLAVSYAHAVRYLKRPRVDKDAARSVARSCAEELRRSS